MLSLMTQMYEDLEQILERCGPAVPSAAAIAYLTVSLVA